MTTRLTIDAVGRVLLPKPLRKALCLSPGDMLELESAGEKITRCPVRSPTPLAREKGVWVFRTGQPLPATTTDNLLKEMRNEWDRRNIRANE